jgi:HSP20 family protein
MQRKGSDLADKWWRWKKRSGLDEFSKEFDKLEKMVDEMMNDSTKVFVEKHEEKFPNLYFFDPSVSIGPAGKSQVHRSSWLQSPPQDAQRKKENEPLLDILDYEKEVIVVAELCGVDKKDMKLDVSESALRISVDTPERSFHENICLPAKVSAHSIRASCKNGVLEVRLKKVDGRLLRMKKRLISSV